MTTLDDIHYTVETKYDTSHRPDMIFEKYIRQYRSNRKIWVIDTPQELRACPHHDKLKHIECDYTTQNIIVVEQC